MQLVSNIILAIRNDGAIFDIGEVQGLIPPPDITFIVIFDILHIFAFVLLGALILTVIMCARPQRCSFWFFFISAWFITSFSNLLLLGRQTGPAPPFGLCLFQASLVYASPAM